MSRDERSSRLSGALRVPLYSEGKRDVRTGFQNGKSKREVESGRVEVKRFLYMRVPLIQMANEDQAKSAGNRHSLSSPYFSFYFWR
jgi:hypothetical protein